jgi:transposase-like protein
MPSSLSAPHLHNEEAAYAYVEARIWPDGPVCPHCGGVERLGKLGGKSTRIGTYKCYQCRKPFTVKIGTIFEASHVPMHIWLQAIYLIAGSKKGVSSNQLHRTLGVTLKTAWFMSHRIREAMREGNLAPFGSDGGIVEVDETFIGFDPDTPAPAGARPRAAHKMKVLSLIERNTGRARSMVVDNLKAPTIGNILGENLAREAFLMTDDFAVYSMYGPSFAGHGIIKHVQGEYVNRLNPAIHTNTVEGFFSIFKRGMRGVYQHCSKKHLHRYVAEFDFRYSYREANGVDDRARADNLLRGIIGKRLTYDQSCARA